MEVKIKEHLFKQAEGKDGPSDSLDRLKRLTQLENSMLSQVEVKIRKLNSDRLPFDTCIVIFHSERNKIDFQEKFREVGQVHTESIFGVENNSILMEQAPEPREIIWENIKYESTRKYSILLGWTLSILFLIVIWIVYFYLQELKSKFIESSMHSNADPDKAYADEVKAIVVALLTFFGVIMFNKFVMGNVLSYFTKLEHHDHVDYFQFSFASKYAFGMLFTTALMTIVVEAIQ